MGQIHTDWLLHSVVLCIAVTAISYIACTNTCTFLSSQYNICTCISTPTQLDSCNWQSYATINLLVLRFHLIPKEQDISADTHRDRSQWERELPTLQIFIYRMYHNIKPMGTTGTRVFFPKEDMTYLMTYLGGDELRSMLHLHVPVVRKLDLLFTN